METSNRVARHCRLLLDQQRWLANGVAFVCAAVASYNVNTLWSFSQPFHGKNPLRFLLVAMLGALISVAVSAMAEVLGLRYLLGIAAVVVAVPAMTFLLHANWTYRYVTR